MAYEAAERAARPANGPFIGGYPTDSEPESRLGWLTALRDEPPDTVRPTCATSALEWGRTVLHGSMAPASQHEDRAEPEPELRMVAPGPLLALPPVDHARVRRRIIRFTDINGMAFINS